MPSMDPYKLSYLRTLVTTPPTDYRRQAPQLYSGAAQGYGYINLNDPVKQIIRSPNIEATLPHVPNKSDPHPILSTPDPKPLTLEAKTFRAGIRYYWEDEVDDTWGYWRRQARAFGTSIERTIELLAHEPFNRYADPTYTSGWDNLTLANTAHLLEGGGTYDNTLPAQPPSEALLEQILDYFDNIPTPYGYPMRVGRIYIITGDNYARRWQQILNSPTAIAHPFSPGTTANQNPNIPPLITSGDGRVTVISAPYLVDKNLQFAIGEGHELVFARRWQYVDSENSKNPRATVQYAGVRLLSGWGDARRVLVVKV